MTMDNVSVELLERLTKLGKVAGDLLDGTYDDSRLVLTTGTHVAVAYWNEDEEVALRVTAQPRERDAQ